MQRVREARVVVDGETVGEIGVGVVALVGVTHGDDEAAARKMADRIYGLRIFPDAQGVMNVSARDAGAAILVVSQFTLYGDTSRGRRPSWVQAARPEQAEPLIETLVAELQALGAATATGRFRADMQVTLTNDGPVTLILET